MNPLLLTDVYKLGHMRQYPPDTTEVYSYLEARKPGHNLVWFGLQYILQKYLSKKITTVNGYEFEHYHEQILGPVPADVKSKIHALVQLGYWPLEIKTVAEGSIVPSGNVLLSIKNTHPDFYWCVGFVESLLLKVWYPTTVATASRSYYNLVRRFAEETCDDLNHLPFQVHDFGYRGVSSEESAAIAGAAHLLNFNGSDTVSANRFLDEFYDAVDSVKGLSVPASEHSVMCSYGREGEWAAFDRMLELYPTGIVSIVSDSYDYWKVLTEYAPSRRQQILEREGKVVFRPDSGNPKEIICGRQLESSPEGLGSLNLLWTVFGGTVNSKGYKVLNPKVGLIYGDGMYYERFLDILTEMKRQGFASSNLVIGVGGILLQNHSRDEFGFAVKATHIKRKDGSSVEIFKDPKTDQSKRSKRGYMSLFNGSEGFTTIDQVDETTEAQGLLKTVFYNGRLTEPTTLDQIRENIKATA